MLDRFMNLRPNGLNIIYGSVDDIFLLKNYKIAYKEVALTYHLKDLGFERIIFYNRLYGIHTYDEESYKKFFTKEYENNLRQNKEDNVDDKRPLGKRRLLNKKSNSNNVNVSKNRNINEKIDSLGQKLYEIFPNQSIHNAFIELDRILSDRKVKTAVIISEAEFNYINQTEIKESISSLISRNWYRIPKENFIGFLFSSHKDLNDLENYIKEYLTFLNKAIDDKSIFRIPNPYSDEHKRLLHFERLTNELSFDWAKEEYMIRLLNMLDIPLKDKKILIEEKIKEKNKKILDLEIIKSLDKSFAAYDKPAIEVLESLIGLENVKKEIKSYIRLIKNRRERNLSTTDLRMHIIFKGNPGTGKTTVARLLAQILAEEGILRKGHLVECGRQDLIGEHLGESTHKTINKINQALDGVLFIDEAYSLLGEKGNEDAFGKEVIDTLIKEMEDKKDKLVVVLAGYSQEMDEFLESNSGLKSRFSSVIEFQDYTIDELKEIFLLKAKNRKLELSEELLKSLNSILEALKISKGKNFGNARDVENLLQDIEKNWILRTNGKGQLDLIDVPKSYLRIKYKEDIVFSINVQRIKSRIIGQDNAIDGIIEQLRKNIKKSNFDEKRKKVLASFLLVGPTGVGKTETVKAFYSELKNLDYQYLRFDMGNFSESHTASTLTGSPRGYVGSEEGGALTRPLLKNPRALILFDEIEKGHPTLYKTFMSLLDEGQIQETSTGRIATLSYGIIFFTSNLYQEIIKEINEKIDDKIKKELLIKDLFSGKFDKIKNIVNKEVFLREINRRLDERTGRPFMFPPEFIARIDKIIFYKSLEYNDLLKITKNLFKTFGIDDNKLAETLTKKYLNYAKEYGVRDFIRKIENEIL